MSHYYWQVCLSKDQDFIVFENPPLALLRQQFFPLYPITAWKYYLFAVPIAKKKKKKKKKKL